MPNRRMIGSAEPVLRSVLPAVEEDRSRHNRRLTSARSSAQSCEPGTQQAGLLALAEGPLGPTDPYPCHRSVTMSEPWLAMLALITVLVIGIAIAAVSG